MTESLDDILLSDPTFWKRPDKYDILARFRRERPISRQTLPGGEGSYWSLTRHKETREITKNDKLFVSRYGTGMASSLESPDLAYEIAGMVNRDAPDHPRLRRIAAKVFTPRLLKEIEGDIAASARAVVGAISERGECDFAADVANQMPLKVIGDMLAVPEGNDRNELARLSTQAQGYGDENQGDEDDSLDAFFALNDYGEKLSRERRKAPGDDLLSKLVTAEVDGEKLTDRDAGIYFQLLITAGFETTASSIAQGMSFLPTPGPVARLARRLRGTGRNGAGGDCPLWDSRCALWPHGGRGHRNPRPAHRRGRNGRVLVYLGQPRRGRVRRA